MGPDFLKTFVWFPLASIAVVGLLFVQLHKAEVQKNWVQYQCHPAVIPLAGMFTDGAGKPIDAFANAQYCSQKIGHAVLSQAMEPVRYIFSSMGDVLKDATSSIDAIRSMLMKVRTAITDFVDTVANKIIGVASEVTVLMNRLRDILARMIGSGTLMVGLTSTMMSMLDSFNSLALGFVRTMVTAAFVASLVLSFMFPEFLAFTIPLGAQLGITYCFDPLTMVSLADGSCKAMKDVNIGDILQGNDEVTGTMVLDGELVQMYVLHGVRVSGWHKVLHGKVWTFVKDHPDAIPCPPCSRLVCLITSSNRIQIGDLLFTDYEEVSSDSQLRHIETLVWDRAFGEEYVPGLAGSAQIVLANDDVIAIEDAKVGMLLPGDDVIEAVVKLYAADASWYEVNGLVLTGNTWLASPQGYRRARYIATANATGTGPSYSLITAKGTFCAVTDTGICVVRDYLDTHNDAKLQEIERFVMQELQDNVARDLERMEQQKQ